MFIHTNMPHTPVILHTFFTALTLLHTIVFTLKHCYAQTLLHTDALTQTLLHRESFTLTNTLNADAFTDNHYYTQALVHADALPEPTKIAKKPSVFDTQTSFRSKGLLPDQPKSQKIISF